MIRWCLHMYVVVSSTYPMGSVVLYLDSRSERLLYIHAPPACLIYRVTELEQDLELILVPRLENPQGGA